MHNNVVKKNNASAKEDEDIPTIQQSGGKISQEAIIAHLKFGCRNFKCIKHIGNHDALESMPRLNDKNITNWICPICTTMKVPCLPANLSTVMLNLAPGQLLHMDFAFMNVISVQDFQSYLSCTDDTTSYPFTFPTWNKRPPLDLIKFVVLSI